jgi:hypothetical protein
MSDLLPLDDEPGTGHRAAVAARDAVEDALFSLPQIALDLDRAGVRDRLLRAIQHTYAIKDTSVTARAHLDGLTEGAAIVMEGRVLLERAGDPAKLPPLARAIERLAAAEAALRAAAGEVAQIQLDRRLELTSGAIAADVPPPQPFRAGTGLPALHALARRSLLPHVNVDAAVPIPVLPAPPITVPRPTTIEELKRFADDAASGALAARTLDAPDPEPAADAPPAPFAFEPAIEETEALRRIARDCLENIAIHRVLRLPNAMESWLDQAPFEQRLIDLVDAFAACGGTALPLVSLFHAEAKAPDPERAFSVAFTLGCIAGSDTVGAAVMTLKQSAPEEGPGWVEGFSLAPNPAVDAAMADLCGSPRPVLVSIALDVLHARGGAPASVIGGLLDRPEPAIALRVARALATSLPREEALSALESIIAHAADDAVVLAATEALLRRGHGRALDVVRDLLGGMPSASRRDGALRLLCFAGRPSDLDTLLAAVDEAPTAAMIRDLGRFGHTSAIPALIAKLTHEDPEIGAAAAEALDRITGAGLRETVMEPWDIDLPPEAIDDRALPIPLREVERIIADPAAWSRWLDAHGKGFDPKIKLRAGAPFSPRRIVDELEAKSTPPASRHDAALELALVTGLVSPFSPADWVARQQQHLADLRSRVASLPVTPGAWSSARPPSAADPVRPPQRAWRPVAAAPAASLPPTVATPLLATTPLATIPPANPHVTNQEANPAPGDSGPVTQVQPPVQLASTRPRESAETETRTAPLAPFAPPPALPFAASAPLPPRPEAPPAALDVLPFRATNPSPNAAREPKARQPPAASRPSSLTLAQYAGISLDLRREPANAEAIRARYGFADGAAWTAENELWRHRMARDPDLQTRWFSLLEQIQARRPK